MLASSSTDAVSSALQATALTARCHNPFFRQKQLKFLHDTLRQHSSALRDAILQDTRVTIDEANVEVALALDTVKEHYESIQPDRELEDEYRVAKGKDNHTRREPWGVAYIELGDGHTPLFSVTAVLSAAIVAGNCVALKLENTLHTLPSLLRSILPQALESDTFAVVSSSPSDEATSQCIQVLQEYSIRNPAYTQLVSQDGLVVAIVDRTADLASAAQQIVAARFAFGGTSPYAPDLILVNEYVKKEFSELVLKSAIGFLANSKEASNSSAVGGQKKQSRISEALDSINKSRDWSTSIITRGDHGAIIEISDLNSLPPKLHFPIFCISSITSLEHAINQVDESLEPQARLLAAYHFGTPTGGKYLSQFIKADISFVNHIPYRILLGPSAPLFHAVDVDKRYNIQHLTRSSPTFIKPSSSSSSPSQTTLEHVLLSKDQGAKIAAIQMLSNSTKEIKEMKRPEWVATGFFEQGIRIGLGVYGVPFLACVGASLYYGVGYGLRRLNGLW